MTEDKQPEVAQQTDAISDKTQEPDRELQRLKRALQRQQTEKAEALAELEKIRKSAEDDKLSATERERKELEATRKEAAELGRLVKEREAENARLKLVNRLVTKHKLEDEEYADVVLKHYKPEEHEDFDAFVEDLAAQPRYKKFFVQAEAAAPRPPAVPGSGNTRDKAPTITAEETLRAEARALFPNPQDEARRQGYINNRLKLKGGA